MNQSYDLPEFVIRFLCLRTRIPSQSRVARRPNKVHVDPFRCLSRPTAPVPASMCVVLCARCLAFSRPLRRTTIVAHHRHVCARVVSPQMVLHHTTIFMNPSAREKPRLRSLFLLAYCFGSNLPRGFRLVATLRSRALVRCPVLFSHVVWTSSSSYVS